MGITCSRNESFACFCLFVCLSLELICIGDSRKKSSIPLLLVWHGKVSPGWQKGQKSRRAGAQGHELYI